MPSLFEQIEQAGSVLSPEQIPAALGELERLKALLTLRLTARASPPAAPDRLLTVEEAAPLLAIAADTLYRKARSLPFAVRLPGRQVRFSASGIQKFIRSRQGR